MLTVVDITSRVDSTVNLWMKEVLQLTHERAGRNCASPGADNRESLLHHSVFDRLSDKDQKTNKLRW